MVEIIYLFQYVCFLVLLNIFSYVLSFSFCEIATQLLCLISWVVSTLYIWVHFIIHVNNISPFFLFILQKLKLNMNMKLLSHVRLFATPMDCSLPGSSVHGIFQAIVLEWIAISFSRGSSQPRDQTQVSCIIDRYFTVWAIREIQKVK